MFTLATDVQKIIVEFLKPEEIKKLYESCKDAKIMFEELTKHTNFMVNCKKIMSDKKIQWFEFNKIRLNLLKTYEIKINGYQCWYKNGELHRDNDLPAIITPNEKKYWYKNGLRHRDNDLPAVILQDEFQFWYKNGELHRDNDLPAIIYTDGTQKWFQNGERHRDNNLPAIIEPNGNYSWYIYGKEYFPN